MTLFQNTRKRAMTRGWPIIGFCGPNGGGKSAAMVWTTLPSLSAGRPVLSTVRLLDFANPRECDGCDDAGHTRPVYGPVRLGSLDEVTVERLAAEYGIEPEAVTPWHARLEVVDHLGFPVRDVIGTETHKQAHPLYVPFTDWEQLLEAKSCDVLMDEVTGVASSRESQAMPSPVANKLVQLRRNDVIVRWSAPSWARADKIVRECSQAVVYCRGFLAKSAPGTDRMWRQRRMFQWKTYDAADFEDFTSGKREQMKALQSDWHWGPKSPVFSAYDTYDAVSTIGSVTDSGRCYRCGGRREIPKCGCGGVHSDSGPAEDAGAGKAGGRSRRSSATPLRQVESHSNPSGARPDFASMVGPGHSLLDLSDLSS